FLTTVNTVTSCPHSQRPPSEAFLGALGDATVDELGDLTVCAPRSVTSALRSCTSRWPASAIGRGMRRRSPLAPHSTELKIPAPTPSGSATDAPCLRAPTRSG